MEDLLTVQQAADLKGVSRHTIYNAIREGNLDGQKVLGKTAVKRADLEAWESAGHGGPRPGQGRPKKTQEGETAP